MASSPTSPGPVCLPTTCLCQMTTWIKIHWKYTQNSFYSLTITKRVKKTVRRKKHWPRCQQSSIIIVIIVLINIIIIIIITIIIIDLGVNKAPAPLTILRPIASTPEKYVSLFFLTSSSSFIMMIWFILIFHQDHSSQLFIIEVSHWPPANISTSPSTPIAATTSTSKSSSSCLKNVKTLAILSSIERG